MNSQDKPARVRFKTILFASDFFDNSRLAQRAAVEWARYFDAKLVLTHVFCVEEVAMVANGGIDASTLERENSAQLLERLKSQIAQQGLPVESVFGSGDPAKEILQTAKAHRADLIVMGTHGGGYAGHIVLGSVAKQVLRASHCPVLTLGPNVVLPQAAPFRLERLLYATDFTPASAHAAPYALSLAQEFQAEIDLCHVLPEGRGLEVQSNSDLIDAYGKQLKKLVPREAWDWCNPQYFVMFGSAVPRLREMIESRKIDLTVLGVRKTHSRLSAFFCDGAAFRLIADAACPVLTVGS